MGGGRQAPLDILIVDDSAAIRTAAQRVLRQTGIPIGQIYEAGDGIEALEVLKGHAVSVILSDMNMPKMNGLALLAAVKAEPAWTQIPVVLMTTTGSRAKVTEAVRLGAAGFVRKPFTAGQIREKLRGLF